MSKYLNDGEYLVKKNKIEIINKKQVQNKPDLISNLNSFIIQKPNGKWLLMNRAYLHYKAKQAKQGSRLSKIYSNYSEVPSLFNKNALLETSINMEKYLRFSKGYYNAKVYPKVVIDKNKATITYFVDTEKQYVIRSKAYFGKDTSIINLITSLDQNSYLKPGEPIDETRFENERSRIVQELHQRGYAGFSKNNIDYKADSSHLNFEMDLFITIQPPQDDSIHRQYTIGSVEVIADYAPEKQIQFDSITRDSIRYFYNNYMFVRAKTLSRYIELKPNQLYNKSDIEYTYKSLANLGTYRYINIQPTQSDTSKSVLDYKIYLTPIPKPWTRDGLIEMYYSSSGLDLLGFSFTPTLSNINLLGGGEKFSTGLEANFDFNTKGWTYQNIGLVFKNKISYPRLLDPIGRFIFGKMSTYSPTIKNLKRNAKTDIGLDIAYSRRIKQKSTTSVQGSYGYTMKYGKNQTHYFSPINVQYLKDDLDTNFVKQITPILAERIFGIYFISGFIFQNYNWIYTMPVSRRKYSYAFNIRFEQSGAEIHTLNKIFSPNKEWVIKTKNEDVEFSKYVLGDFINTWKYTLTKKQSLAGKFRFGIVVPFGYSGVPFIKRFFIGGANSLRAWSPYEIGPGGYKDALLNPDPSGVFAQTGEMLMEANIEYRFPIWSYFEGALFTDVGNIYSLDKLDGRENASFKISTFYNYLAIGYGMGLRLNLNFLLLRLDAGYKLKNTYISDKTNSYWVRPAPFGSFITKPSWNLAINYPF